jgi:hypothetical protein
MASPIPYDPSRRSLLHPAAGATFFADWTAADFDRAEHGLLCAEMSRLAYADPAVARRALAGIGFTAFDAVGGEGLIELLRLRGTQGFVAHHPQRSLTVLAFRGTESGRLEDLFLDGETRQQEMPGAPEILVHSGFADAWSRVREQALQQITARGGRLLVTGHSLGAGIATLAAVDTEPAALITFGSPLVGNGGLGALVRSKAAICHRYVDCCDLVTRVPPERFDREHVGRLFLELAEAETLGGRLGAHLAHLAVQTGADALAAVFSLSHFDPEFTHVCPALYADRTGALRPGISAEEIRKDQETARRQYQRTLSSAALRDLADHAPINYVSIFTGRR